MVPASRRPFVPAPVAKYFDSLAGSATASNTSCTGLAMRPLTFVLRVIFLPPPLVGRLHMLYFYNMSIESAEDRVFRALAAPIRRRLLDRLKNNPQTTGDLCTAFEPLDRCTVMQHLKVLEDADLIIAVRRGRERWNHL